MDEDNVWVVIVSYNSGEHLRSLCASLQKQTISHNVVIVDNASTDKSLDFLKKSNLHCTIITNEANRGFAVGANQGASFANGKDATHIIFINPDAVLTPDCMEHLVRSLDDGAVGAVSPVIYKDFAKEELWFKGGEMDFWRHRVTHSEDEVRTRFLSGCILALRSDVFEKVGGFDEQFYLYYEDADLSLRLRKNGYKLMVEPDAEAFHAEQSEDASVAKTYFLTLSGLLFFDKHTHRGACLWFVFFSRLRYIFSTLKKAWLHARGATVTQKETQNSVVHAFETFYEGQGHHNFIPHRKLR